MKHEKDNNPTAEFAEENLQNSNAADGNASESEIDVNEGEEQNEGESAESVSPEERITELEQEVEKQKKEYLFLAADFQNYRKRTLQEKQDMLKNGAKDALLRLLPVVDDFELALKSMAETCTDETQVEGVRLIYNKFINYLKGENVTPIESTGKDFDVEFHDAVTTFPAADESQKGKVIDTVLTGYLINGKVLRHAKVVVGQ